MICIGRAACPWMTFVSLFLHVPGFVVFDMSLVAQPWLYLASQALCSEVQPGLGRLKTKECIKHKIN